MCCVFVFKFGAASEIYTLSLHDALPISARIPMPCQREYHIAPFFPRVADNHGSRSEEHTSELQSRLHLVCRLLLEKKKILLEIVEHTFFPSLPQRYVFFFGRTLSHHVVT